ncbi:hypothetical protein [Cystobacter ferrugineus]|uniref:Uncharacterized protein n=1 Tax=Cystobacter ferrugineus TaxID=83449 RepID=A0A1L9BJT8_9BACT|nr:hypothetical protein [Cystobacter ferrugineus]OJH42507.1 hypothetical protein BON30_04755 [Cystobacter ferrugineus]
MPQPPLHLRLVNNTGQDRRVIVYQDNVAAEPPDSPMLYVWDSRLLQGGGGQGILALPTTFEVAGMTGAPPDYSLSAPMPGQYGQGWALQQDSPEEVLRLIPSTDPASANAVQVENTVIFARRSAVILKERRLLFGAELVPFARASFTVESSFWVALSELRRGDPLSPSALPSQRCQVTYAEPSGITEYVVTLNEKTSTGEVVFTVTTHSL